MDKLKMMYETLEDCIYKQMENGLENVDCDEMGKAIDMLFDISKTHYYNTVTLSMEEKIMRMRPDLTMDMMDRE